MSAGIRLTDKGLLTTVSHLIGIKTSPTVGIGPIRFDDFVEQLLAGKVGDEIAAAVSGNNTKEPARAASSTNINISTGLVNGVTIGGVVVATGNRVLLFGQADETENGLYPIVAAGASARTADANEAGEILGMRVFVQEGTYAGRVFDCAATAPVVVGTTPLPFRVGLDLSSLLAPLAALQTAINTINGLVKRGTSSHAAAAWGDDRGFVVARIDEKGGYHSPHFSIRPSDYPGFVFRDKRGFVGGRIGATSKFNGLGGGASGGAPQNFDPYFPPNLFGWAGQQQKVFLEWLFPNLGDPELCHAAILGAEKAAADGGTDNLTFTPDKLGVAATIVGRPRNFDGFDAAFRAVNVITTPTTAPAVENMSPVILPLGESNTQPLGQIIKPMLEAKGFTPTFVGSRILGGVAGEGRSGWESGDMASAKDVTPVTDFAAYNALSSADKLNLSPFHRASTGGDDPADVMESRVLDFTRYQANVPGITTPTIIPLNFGTNDIVFRPVNDIYALIYANDKYAYRRIHATWPDAKILRWHPIIPKCADTDVLRPAFEALFRAMFDAARDYGGSKVFVVPTWLSSPADAGFALAAGAITPAMGAVRTKISDWKHQQGGAQLTCFDYLTAAIAAAARNLI